jgi:hypothetical protein
MMLSLMLVPVANSSASNVLQPDALLQTNFTMVSKLLTQHMSSIDTHQHGEQMQTEDGSHKHERTSIGDCCSPFCIVDVICDESVRMVDVPSETYLQPRVKTVVPSKWDALLRPPNT